jgi:NodT family efflux transporter outer membrane factor (OMF) lipoprotein
VGSRSLQGLFACLLAGLTAGCAVGPDFVHPDAPAVDRYDTVPTVLPAPGGADATQRLVAAITRDWWALLQSPDLDDAITQAIAASPTLESARAALAEADELVNAARGAYYPQIDGSAGASRVGARTYGKTSSSLATKIFSFGPMLSYTPDLFGRDRRFVEQQGALAESQRQQLAGVYVTLTASVAAQAITIASTLAQIKAAEDVVAADEHNLELVRIAYQAGSVARTDVLSAESQLAGDRTLLPPLRQQLGVARHALTVLVGKTPGEWAPPDFVLDTLTLPTDLPLTVPSELVHDRPDILAAEAQLHAASAAIGLATAQLYPTITLSASVALETLATSGSFSGPIIASNLAAGLTAPLFHGGSLLAQRRAAVDAYAAQLGAYRQTVLLAFGQVADVLQALQHDAELLGAENTAVTTSDASLRLAQDAYAAGRGSLLQVLDAQRLYGQALLGYAHAKGQRYLDTILLFEAMGGTWRDWVASVHR